jgi:hypothetical protein
MVVIGLIPELLGLANFGPNQVAVDSKRHLAAAMSKDGSNDRKRQSTVEHCRCRGEQPPPSEQTLVLLAKELNEKADVLLALAGKVSNELQAIIRRRPNEFAELLRQLKGCPRACVAAGRTGSQGR